MPTGGGPAAAAVITGGKYRFTKETGPVVGKQNVQIVHFPQREEVPPGTPKKDAKIIPDDRFKKAMPKGGWTEETEINANTAKTPVDFALD